MHSFLNVDSGASDAAWARFAARQALDRAVESMDAAGASLVSLIADTGWAADGVRALHARLLDVQSGARAEGARLAERLHELEWSGS